MDFYFSPQERAFQKELHSFLERQVPDWYTGIFVLDHADYERAWDFSRDFARRLARQGWLVRNWPREYGGVGASIWEQVLFSEEMVYFEEPRGANYMGHNWVGPTLMRFGTPEQKAEHLPRIANAEAIWCQGFSEPDAGSDLAADTALQAWGLLGQLERGDRRAPLDGRFLRMFYWCLEGTVAGGTSEIQRNIIAQRGLGLPRA